MRRITIMEAEVEISAADRSSLDSQTAECFVLDPVILTVRGAIYRGHTLADAIANAINAEIREELARESR